ncbi:dihydrolipoyl dehydrogenase [Acetonema longum]|uniref:Dihydrolipoyl dehydrogenase n=1 Tax=Acetonema longum DSM 6540 TaxID=1009370 RepID=F7NPI2_9FIRM|nr:dihydrolipoyl dehydrogenase [Acetonema longum]EGO62062.1 dihydrolipoamide dehydrogenase [Acetonema longum DSM 6540]
MYDIAVIGGGPGGYVAAIRAAQLGAKVLLVEKEKLGGVCLNRGCIPTKTLLNSAERWHELQQCGSFGLQAGQIGFDFTAVMRRKDQVVEQLQSGIVQLVAGNGITVCQGTASLQGKEQLAVRTAAGTEIYQVRRIILATGSDSVTPPLPGIELPGVIGSDQVLSLSNLPRSMAIIGAGAVGVEFATIFQAFGSEITLIEMQPSILPNIDSDLVKRMALLLRKRGIELLTATKVTSIRQGADGLILTAATGDKVQEIAAEKVLNAVGRRPNLSGLGLETAGVAYDRQGIPVDAKMETNIPGIYAVGDLTGRYMWAHAASAEGIVAAENALGGNTTMNYTAVPGCIFTDPEIATVGLSEEEAVAAGRRVRTGRFNFAGIGKAVAMGKPDGLAKIVADEDSGAVLGLHILGSHASDLIMEGVAAVNQGLTIQDLKHMIHPHPTLAEVIGEAAHNTEGLAIHQLRLGGGQRS